MTHPHTASTIQTSITRTQDKGDKALKPRAMAKVPASTSQ
jgi:hypothetical protein